MTPSTEPPFNTCPYCGCQTRMAGGVHRCVPESRNEPPFNSLRDIATHIRYHADISTRPGQYDSLNKLADELMRVAEGLRDAEPSDGAR